MLQQLEARAEEEEDERNCKDHRGASLVTVSIPQYSVWKEHAAFAPNMTEATSLGFTDNIWNTAGAYRITIGRGCGSIMTTGVNLVNELVFLGVLVRFWV